MIADFLGVVSREPNTDVGRLITDIGVDLSARGYATIGQVGGNACFWARPPHADLIHSCVAQMDRVVTCIDGTIYNREELLRGLPRRAEGSDRLSDADLVGRLLEAHGTHALPNIVGDFSLSYWDQGRQLLLLARDIIGIRSLFWHVGTSLVYWYWSTCIDDLAALLRRTVINKRWISYYIQSGILGESPGSETIYIGIYRVPPGSFVEIAAGRARVTQYWRPDRLPSIHYATWLEYVDHFRHLLSVAVGERLACRSHILATLSGGLDSSAVVSLAHYLLSKAGRQGSLTTYSLVFDQTPEANERRFSRAVRDYLGVENVELIADNAWEPPSDVSAMAGLLGEPTDRVVWGQLKFETQVAAKGDADVVLRGEGGDHLFDGSLILLAEMLRQGRLRDFCWSCVAAARWERTSVWRPAYEYGIGPLLFPFLFALNPVWSQTTGLHMPQAPEWLSLRHGELVIDRTALLDFFPAFRVSNPVRRHVVNVLATQNTWSTISRYDRQFGVEARWPFLDKRLVEYALAVPQAVLLDLLHHAGEPAFIMRRLLDPYEQDDLPGRTAQQIRHRTRPFGEKRLGYRRRSLDEAVVAGSGGKAQPGCCEAATAEVETVIAAGPLRLAPWDTTDRRAARLRIATLGNVLVQKGRDAGLTVEDARIKLRPVLIVERLPAHPIGHVLGRARPIGKD